MYKQVLTGLSMIAATAVIIWAGSARADEVHHSRAVVCDRQEELESVYAIHTAMPEMPFEDILKKVKATLGTDGCMPVLATYTVLEKVKEVKSDADGDLDLDRISLTEACVQTACVRFPTPQTTYILLKRPPSV